MKWNKLMYPEKRINYYLDIPLDLDFHDMTSSPKFDWVHYFYREGWVGKCRGMLYERI